VRVNVGQAKTNLSKLLAHAEAGEDIEIARGGIPVAKLVPIESPTGPGARFLAAHGSLEGKIQVGDDFELSEEELDEILDEPL
jgi:prevent-host-death family protein